MKIDSAVYIGSDIFIYKFLSEPKMNTTTVIALSSILALALPLTILLITGLFKYRSFPALSAYYAIMIFDNCIGEGYIPVSKEFSHISAVTSNLLDPILMLIFLTHFGQTSKFKKSMLRLTLAIAATEIASVTLFGYNDNGLAVALGPGLAAVFGLSVFFFRHQVKLSVGKSKAIGKAVIVAALIFMYGSYFVSYLMYFVFKSPDIANSYLVLYFINILSSCTMSIGVVAEKYRVEKLKELLMARKEIAEIYAPSHVQSVPQLQNAVYTFRKENESKNVWKIKIPGLFHYKRVSK
ncbi:MAG: hypothetical protein ABUT20_10490 [Bacteroidota bacterium]